MKGDGETASGEDSGLEVEVVRGQAIHINPTILDNIFNATLLLIFQATMGLYLHYESNKNMIGYSTFS